MRRLHIVGGKNHGKTTLVVELVRELVRRGIKVGTIKHTHHHHELDIPGKDSYRHREAGASTAAILSPSLNAVFWSDQAENGRPPAGDERYQSFVEHFRSCDLVLVEGDTQTNAPKLEVWRAERGTVPLADSLSGVIAVITDDQPAWPGRLIPRRSLPDIADFVVQLMK